ncbi:MAG TPA: STT3 domain-containing protein [Candidatus Acidoferrales bacterium]|nr:STT3 domain-containing protein [Candidatus Acidoferrales bacterium]
MRRSFRRFFRMVERQFMRATAPLLILACVAVVGWVHALPLQLHGAEAVAKDYVRQEIALHLYRAANGRVSQRDLEAQTDQWIAANRGDYEKQLAAKSSQIAAAHRFTAADNREYAYLGDQDSYTWLRMARNYLQHGSTCDAVVDGECRDTFVNAPLGTKMIYGRSLHIAAIVVLQRIIEWFHPGYPLSATSFWIPGLLAMLSVAPAFVIGRRLGGLLAGVGAALMGLLNPLVLARTVGSDNDPWNVLFPLCLVAAVIKALDAVGRRQQVLWGFAAGLCAALHATTWSGWPFACLVVIAGLIGSLGLQLVASFVVKPKSKPQRRGQPIASTPLWTGRMSRTVIVATTVLLTSIVLIALLAPDQLEAAPMLRLNRFASRGATLPSPTISETGVWPNIMATVDELRKSDLAFIGDQTFGPLYLFVAFVGILLMALPSRRWTWVHLVLFGGGTVLYGWLLQAALEPVPTLFLSILPLAAGLLSVVLQGDAADLDGLAASLMVIFWWLGTLFVSFGGVRFILLLAPSMGVAVGVVVGRAYELAVRLSQRLPVPLHRLAVMACALLCIAAYLPAGQMGYLRSRDYLPPMNDAWWDTLTNLRQKASPDAIVDAWWDYGYWVKYVADRRVTADGSTLQTHLPYWLGRALVSADETESAGLLRMLSCGSDATPLPEGDRGAYGKVRAKLKDAVAAQAMVVELAKRDRDAAAAYLAAHGFTAAEQEDILASTHCAAPETYLIVGSELTSRDSWMRLAAWDFRRAYIAYEANSNSRDEVVADVSHRFGYSPQEAAALYDQARKQPREEFVIGPAPRAPSVWYPCRPGSEPSTLHCPLGLLDINTHTLIEEFVANTTLPQNSYFIYRRVDPGRGSGPAAQIAPGALVVAEEDLRDVQLPDPRFAETGVLFDTHDWRILVGPPPLIRSTFTHLLFLDGRYAKHFKKFDDRQSYNGDRLVTWRVRF